MRKAARAATAPKEKRSQPQIVVGLLALLRAADKPRRYAKLKWMRQGARQPVLRSILRQLPRAIIATILGALIVIALAPSLLRRPHHRTVSPVVAEDETPALYAWGSIGGCGASGGAASSTAGGAKWVGRGVRGGLVDLQCLASQTIAEGGVERPDEAGAGTERTDALAFFTTINTRIATEALLRKWIFALNVPIVYKNDEVVDAGNAVRRAGLAGFGDLSFEVTRKLGIANDTSLSLLLSLPSGSADAVRAGIELPQHLQLGAGVVGLSLLLEQFRDLDPGLLVYGGTFSFSGLPCNEGGSCDGWRNDRGDYRAPTAAAYVYYGYMLGPFVPSMGLTASVKFDDDRQQFEPLDQPRGLAVINLATEWSNPWVALLLSASAPFSAEGSEGVTLSLGVQTSVF